MATSNILHNPLTVDELSAKNSVNYKGHGFVTSFGQVIRKTELNVVIVIKSGLGGFSGPSFDIHVTHGAFGGAFWLNEEAMITTTSLEKAKKIAERLYGITGSGELATVVEVNYNFSRY